MTTHKIKITFTENTWEEFMDFIETINVNEYCDHYPKIAQHSIDCGYFWPSYYDHTILSIWGGDTEKHIHEIKMRWL